MSAWKASVMPISTMAEDLDFSTERERLAREEAALRDQLSGFLRSARALSQELDALARRQMRLSLLEQMYREGLHLPVWDIAGGPDTGDRSGSIGTPSPPRPAASHVAADPVPTPREPATPVPPSSPAHPTDGSPASVANPSEPPAPSGALPEHQPAPDWRLWTPPPPRRKVIRYDGLAYSRADEPLVNEIATLLSRHRLRMRSPRRTILGATLILLRRVDGEGMTGPLLRKALKEEFSPEVHPRSISRTLVKLKNEGLVRYDGQRWHAIVGENRFGHRSSEAKHEAVQTAS